jgi:transcriptional regulator GlxA family with amidase domain
MTETGTKTVAFVLYPGLTPLDLIGPLQVLNRLGSADPCFQVTVVGERVEPMSSDVPVKLLPEKTFDQVPNPYVVLVPGGGLGTIRALGNQPIREYLVAAAETAHTVASVCTGALILGAADLLQGRNATTHWAYARFLERLGAHYLPQRWVQDGKFICAAGVSAGIDMALYLTAKLVNQQLARASQLTIEYDPQPPFGAIDWRQVDRDAQVPSITALIRSELANHPDLVNRLTGPPLGRREHP